MTTLSNHVPAYKSATTIRVDDAATSLSYAVVHDKAVWSLLNWNADDNIWRGYAQPTDAPGTIRGFDAPDLPPRYTFSFNDSTGRHVVVTAQGDTAYVYAFVSRTPNADKHGNHFGLHPKRAFRLPLATVTETVALIKSLIGVDTYPPFAEPDDKRWKRRTVTPKATVVNLRCVPSIARNVPIGRLTAPLGETWVVPDAYVSGDKRWAQMKYGNGYVWLSQEWVTFR